MYVSLCCNCYHLCEQRCIDNSMCTLWIDLLAHQAQYRLGVVIRLLLTRSAGVLAVVRQLCRSAHVTNCVSVNNHVSAV